MAPETEDHQYQQQQSNVTPASNQNLIMGIVMGAVVLLLLLLVISQHFNKTGVSDEVSQLEDDIKDRKARKEALRYSGISGVSQNPDALINQIKSDTDALGRLLNASASDSAMLRTAQDNATSMSIRITDLQTRLGQTQGAAARVAGLEAELANVRQALVGTVDKATADSLREQLALARLERDRLQSELRELRASQGSLVDRNTHALTLAELTELRSANAELRAENQRLLAKSAGSKLFVSAEELSPRAEDLYRELKRIESNNYKSRIQTYTRIDSQMNASVGDSITFKSGSAEIARNHEARLKSMALSAGEKSFFLVVGYASPSGDSLSNQKLSSRRATRVASMVNYLKKNGQAVQAVYLGEGNRFGPDDSPNQVCEVWEIRP